MVTFLPIILICSLSVSPGDCNAETARVVTGSYPVGSELMCMEAAQQTLAQAPGIAPVRGSEYPKFACKRIPNTSQP